MQRLYVRWGWPFCAAHHSRNSIFAHLISLFVFGKSREIFISELTASAAEASLLNVIVKGGGLFPKMAAKMGKFLDKSCN